MKINKKKPTPRLFLDHQEIIILLNFFTDFQFKTDFKTLCFFKKKFILLSAFSKTPKISGMIYASSPARNWHVSCETHFIQYSQSKINVLYLMLKYISETGISYPDNSS